MNRYFRRAGAVLLALTLLIEAGVPVKATEPAAYEIAAESAVPEDSQEAVAEETPQEEVKDPDQGETDEEAPAENPDQGENGEQTPSKDPEQGENREEITPSKDPEQGETGGEQTPSHDQNQGETGGEQTPSQDPGQGEITGEETPAQDTEQPQEEPVKPAEQETKETEAVVTVSGLTAEATRYNTIALTWDKVPGAKGYEVYYSTSEDDGYTLLRSLTRNSYKYTKAVCGTEYFFKVRAFFRDGKEVTYTPDSKVVSVATSIQSPEPYVYKTTYNSVMLKWDRVSGATGYEVMGAESEDGPFELLATVRSTSYTQKKLELGETYYYKVRAVRKDYQADWSDVVSGSTGYEPVKGFKATATATDKIKLTWRRVVGIDHYVIEEYKTESDAQNRRRCQATLTSKKTSCIDDELKEDTTYYYMIYGVKGDYETEVVGPVSARTFKLAARYGIDVSVHNGKIDWNQVARSGEAEYAIIRAGYRGYGSNGTMAEDGQFKANIQGALDAGLKVGVYFYTQAISEDEARAEARFAVSLIKDAGCRNKLTYPIYVDTEASPPGNGRADGLGRSARTRIIKAFCNEVRSQGYKAGIYASKNWFETKLYASDLEDYDIWVAQYSSTCTYGGRYDMWQYTSSYQISGISGRVDRNRNYKAY